ncbi:MAG: hypothetical protein U5L95_03820 [Candidatus Saccharibacteria bacterium]|nr:hypothetical protein [Candidatus Saccharibacteria bacterium]
MFFKKPTKSSQNCKNKRRFKNDTEALAAIKRINPTKANKKPRRSYKCPHCGGYHLTSTRL